VPDGRWSEPSRLRIVKGLEARLGRDVRIAIRTVDAIPAEASGKFRHVVSHVPLRAGLAQASAPMASVE
jgi:phenylacetate-CoA ligase